MGQAAQFTCGSFFNPPNTLKISVQFQVFQSSFKRLRCCGSHFGKVCN